MRHTLDIEAAAKNLCSAFAKIATQSKPDQIIVCVIFVMLAKIVTPATTVIFVMAASTVIIAKGVIIVTIVISVEIVIFAANAYSAQIVKIVIVVSRV